MKKSELKELIREIVKSNSLKPGDVALVEDNYDAGDLAAESVQLIKKVGNKWKAKSLTGLGGDEDRIDFVEEKYLTKKSKTR